MGTGEEDEDPNDGPGLIDLDMKAFGTGTMHDPLRHAMGLRNAQDKCKMRMWDSFPSLFQNTIFHGEQDQHIKSLRHSGTRAEKIQYAKELKDAGNAKLKAADVGDAQENNHKNKSEKEELDARIQQVQTTIIQKEQDLQNLRQQLKLLVDEKSLNSCCAKLNEQPQVGSTRRTEDFEGAVSLYEKAAGLLRYVECIRPDWKNDDGSYKGIEDNHLRVDESAVEGDDVEAAEARDMVTSLYLNMALAHQRLEQFDKMREACDEVLEKVNSTSVKALYRRAQARVGPVGALDADRNAAIRDLQTAAQLAPQDKDVRALLAKLKAEHKAKELSERSAFAGMFDRGEIVTNNVQTVPSNSTPPEKLDLRDPRVQAMLDIYPGNSVVDS